MVSIAGGVAMSNIDLTPGDTVTVHYADSTHQSRVQDVTPYGMILVDYDWYRPDGYMANDGPGWIEPGEGVEE